MKKDEHLRTLTSVDYSVNQTKRPISEGAEKWLGEPIPCLDHGFVYLVDYTGNDSSIVQAARVSYGSGTKKVHEDRGLIRYLMRHHHTTPFEMVELKFHAKMPIFVARQWVRHRTANINEYSGRYSVMLDEFYMPDSAQLVKQSAANRQGRSEDKPLTPEQQKRTIELLTTFYSQQYAGYEEMLEMGLSRELSRIGLSVANYTQWYWKIDLHNLFHFLRLRMDKHAQYEIRVYADAMAQIVKDALPIAWEAFEDYQLQAMHFSRLEIAIFRQLGRQVNEEEALKLMEMVGMDNKREQTEFLWRLRDLNLLKSEDQKD
jgi:thymidylate synthase (FAD)